MIIREHEMIDMVTTYLSSSVNDPLYIGAMTGTNVFKHVLDLSLEYTEFSRILIIEGIQDFIGLKKESLILNHIFYAERFHNKSIELPKDTSTIEKFFKDKANIVQVPVIDADIKADVIIINDAHMIPDNYLSQILEVSNTKTILIVDPFDVNGEPYSSVFTVTESLSALPNLIAKARDLYNAETYALDKRTTSILDAAKLQSKSIGKIDDNQYVTPDEDLLNEINLRQTSSPFKRRQKLLIMDDHIISSPLLYDEPTRECILVKHSLAYIMGVIKDSLYTKLRPHSYTKSVFGRPTYSMSDDSKNVHCKAANILSIEESAYHRFNRIICVLNDKSISTRQLYSLLKNTNHLTLVK